MGNCNCCSKRKPTQRKIALLLLGLDNAGKTVAVHNLSGENPHSVMPTVGISVVNLKYSKYDVKVFDLGGRPDFRDVWQRYYVDAHGIIFVVDSSDYSRMDEAHRVLNDIVTNPKIKGKPILVLANKQDHEEALDEIDLIDKLELESLANENECPTFITSCAATETKQLDDGIKNGYNWLIKSIITDYKHLQKRVEEDIRCQLLLDEEERREKILRIRQAHEEEQQNQVTTIPLNRPTTDIITVQQRNQTEEESVSTKSTDIESIPSDHDDAILHDIKESPERIHSGRPDSATNLIRKQLELGNLTRRSSLPLGNNKVAPMQIFGVKSKSIKSATARNSADSRKLPDRRNLRSAGDSIFIVSRDNHKVMPNNDGGGDLYEIRRDSTVRPFSVIQDVLPPINDIHSHKSQPNGTYF